MDLRFSKWMMLHGPQFQEYIDSMTHPEILRLQPHTRHVPRDQWESINMSKKFVHRMTLPKGVTLSTAQGNKRGSVEFSTDVHIPVIANASGWQDVWMSLTPMELLTCLPSLRHAKGGNVLIGGLGMGLIPFRLLSDKKRCKVTIIDNDPDICKMFGEWLIQAFPGRVQVHCYDFWEYAKEHGSEHSSILVDVWEGYRDAEDDKSLKALKRSHSNVWAWGESY